MTDIAVPHELLERMKRAAMHVSYTDPTLEDELSALLPKPDEAREALADALEHFDHTAAKDVRAGQDNQAVAIIREYGERKRAITREIAERVVEAYDDGYYRGEDHRGNPFSRIDQTPAMLHALRKVFGEGGL